MQTDYILSIGLNVGATEPENQLRDTLRAIAPLGAVRDLAIGRGEWQGVPERFVQVRIAPDIDFGEHRARAGAGAFLARELRQECIAIRRADSGGRWELIDAAGTFEVGCTLAENPVILGRPNAADARADMERAAEGDTIGHSSIQTWSAGPYFPAVISTVERYAPGRSAADSTPTVTHRLTVAGWSEEYATHRDAESVARWVCRDGRIVAERFAALTKGRRHG